MAMTYLPTEAEAAAAHHYLETARLTDEDYAALESIVEAFAADESCEAKAETVLDMCRSSEGAGVLSPRL